MRYADACPRLVVDSIDSDVVLIAMLYAKHGGGPDLFVWRLATHAHGEVVVKNSARSRFAMCCIC